jgi:hypothetical protein
MLSVRHAAQQRQEDALRRVEEIFTAHSPVYVWVVTYSITHSVMKLAIHLGDFPKHTTIVCGGCYYFAGDLQGGPYDMKVCREHDTTGQPAIVLRGNDNELVSKCLRIHIEPNPRADR